ncbi:MAG: hypothetical protein K9N47_27050 [Prosthecobacter sp.]|uniref:hypothetical protein n=1 Tax=Prosthecobacter sp. TaxID=1965333 RepID=UPI00260611AD|nr:hypothetical protein [Prosthecobacter sp.]MCF7789810.1 hypothetical protein [Prosthecobacter sp.]
MPSRHAFILLFLLTHLRVIHAAESAVFTPPQAYSASRYEAGWSKNPFTLKTVAQIAAQDSFARDFAIGAHYGAADNPTVVIVNTRTNERIPLRKDQPAPGGMRLTSVRLSSTRAECQAEVLLGAEAAVLTYDSKYIGQLAATETTRLAAAKPTAATSKQNRLIIPPIPLPGTKPATVVASRQFSPPPLPAPESAAQNSAPARPRFASPPKLR